MRAAAGRIASALVMVGALAGCDSYVRKIDDPYYLVAIDDLRAIEIAYTDGGGGRYTERVPATVTRIGWNKDFVVAERQNDRGRMEYYYIVRAEERGFDSKSSVHGPLSEAEFSSVRARLGLPPLTRAVP